MSKWKEFIEENFDVETVKLLPDLCEIHEDIMLLVYHVAPFQFITILYNTNTGNAYLEHAEDDPDCMIEVCVIKKMEVLTIFSIAELCEGGLR